MLAHPAAPFRSRYRHITIPSPLDLNDWAYTGLEAPHVLLALYEPGTVQTITEQ